MDQSNVIPVTGNLTIPRSERSIGTILIQAGKLSFESAEKILQFQRDHDLRFGEAGIQMGLLSVTDIEFALARQFDHPYLIRGESKVSEQVISAYVPFGPQAEAMSELRSQLMLRWFGRTAEGKALAIISAERREGRSFVAANLAVSFSQLGQKTLLIDADMRNPVQHTLFSMENRSGLSALLSDRGDMHTLIHRVLGLPGLSVLPAGAPPPNPMELLARPIYPQLLADLAFEFEVIILDSPALDDQTDAQNISAGAGAAVIVTRKGTSRISRVRSAADTVNETSATVIGTVLNDF